MPSPIYGADYRIADNSALKDYSYDYDYPEGVDLRPGSELHEKIKHYVLSRAIESRRFMKRRYSTWKKIDNNLTAYVPLDDAQKKLQEKDSRKPVSVVIPVSYATLETLLTYLVASFLEDPYFRYEGQGPEDVLGAIMLEKIIRLQAHRAKMSLDLHTMWRDSIVYGIGGVATTWYKRTETKDVAGVKNLLSKIGIGASRDRVTVYEGNRLDSIDPYMLLLDSNVSVHKVQEAEYIGWVERTTLTNALAQERDDDGETFNVRFLNHFDGRSQLYEPNQTGRTDRYGQTDIGLTGGVTTISRPVDRVWMYASIIPSDFGLGDDDYPQKWLFCIAGDQVVTKAKPLGLDHDMYPIALCAPDFDGHSASPISRIEIEWGMQHAIDFLYSSHIENIRRGVNNMFVVDPEIININDFTESKAGLLARIRQKFWGQGKIDNAIKQLQVNDVTRNNIGDVNFMMDIMQRTSGAVDSLQGVMRSGPERVSATEARDVRSGALSRLEKMARVIGWQAHQDIAYLLASQTKQLMSNDIYVKVAGRWEERLRQDFGMSGFDFAKVSPDALDVSYDIISGDGSMPGSADVSVLSGLLQNQAAAQVLDIPRVIKYIARQAGAKNVDDFIKQGGSVQPTVLPDQQVEQQVQAGNLVPIGGTNGVA
jgi:hypothetical protein